MSQNSGSNLNQSKASAEVKKEVGETHNRSSEVAGGRPSKGEGKKAKQDFEYDDEYYDDEDGADAQATQAAPGQDAKYSQAQK